eukprot:TRINITY_DN2085_c0_g1_i5.p1 TRINITY_DN2085_c0_g1~~TRINITY_DN2085_c0_g1_i5.p1  ORF type:complete len:100 (-),score=20.97 TRINITY_DN2085_c0_g1_i5:143-442(-)
MKFFAILFCIGFAQSGLVRREAEAEAKAGSYGAKKSSPHTVSRPPKRLPITLLLLDMTLELGQLLLLILMLLVEAMEQVDMVLDLVLSVDLADMVDTKN